MYVAQLLYLLICGHLCCFHVLAVVNGTSGNIGVHDFFNFGSLRVYTQEWGWWVIYWFYSWLCKYSPYCSLQWLYQFTFPLTVQEGSLFFTPSPAFIVCRLFNDGHPDWCEVMSHCSFDLCFSNSDIENIFMCLLAILGLQANVHLGLFSHSLIGLFVFLVLICMSCLYLLEINPLSVVSFGIFFFSF